jgi:hypothetical protein
MSTRSWTASAHRDYADTKSMTDNLVIRNSNAFALILGMALTVVFGNAAPAGAQETAPPAETEQLPLYRVEIVIFEQLQPPTRPEDPGLSPLPPLPPPIDDEPGMPGIFVEQARPLPQSASSETTPPGEASIEETEPEPFFFEPVDIEDLAEAAGKLDRRPEYRVLAREAWLQPGFPKDRSLPVDLETLARLRNLIAESDNERLPGLTAGREISRPDAPSRTLSQAEQTPLRASVTLWLGRYLHLEVVADVSTESGVRHLDESRRMRSGEIHYFDSPRLGAIAVVIPVDAPDPVSEVADPKVIEAPATGTGSL